MVRASDDLMRAEDDARRGLVALSGDESQLAVELR
jgi:hypothetical protein